MKAAAVDAVAILFLVSIVVGSNNEKCKLIRSTSGSAFLPCGHHDYQVGRLMPLVCDGKAHVLLE